MGTQGRVGRHRHVGEQRHRGVRVLADRAGERAGVDRPDLRRDRGEAPMPGRQLVAAERAPSRVVDLGRASGAPSGPGGRRSAGRRRPGRPRYGCPIVVLDGEGGVEQFGDHLLDGTALILVDPHAPGHRGDRGVEQYPALGLGLRRGRSRARRRGGPCRSRRGRMSRRAPRGASESRGRPTPRPPLPARRGRSGARRPRAPAARRGSRSRSGTSGRRSPG